MRTTLIGCLFWTLRVSLTQVYGTKDENGTNRNFVLTDGLGIEEDLQVPVNLQLSQPQQQHYKELSGTPKLGYDLDHLAGRPFSWSKNHWHQTVLIAAADCNCIDAFTEDRGLLPATKKNRPRF